MVTFERPIPPKPIRKTENSISEEIGPSHTEGAGSLERADENTKKEASPENLLLKKLAVKEQLTSKLQEVKKDLENLKLTLKQAETADKFGLQGGLNTERIEMTIRGFKIRQTELIAGIQKISNQPDVAAWEKKQAEEKEKIEKEKKKVEDEIRAVSQKLMLQVREIVKEIINLADRKFKLQKETSAQKREYNKALKYMRETIGEFGVSENAKTGKEFMRLLNEAKENLSFIEFGKKSKIESLLGQTALFEGLDISANYLKELILKQGIVDLHIEDVGVKYKKLINEALAMETNELKTLAKKFNISANFSAGVKNEVRLAIEPLISNGGGIINPEKEMIHEVWKSVLEEKQTNGGDRIT